MAYQPSYIYTDPPQAIFLYTTPLRNQKSLLRMKKPVDIFAHWAICIQGFCFELTRGDKDKNEEKYLVKSTPEQDWKAKKNWEGRDCNKEFAGNMAMLYSKEIIDHVAQAIWETSLKKKYVYDENNCQVFIRLLVDLIGDPHTKKNFPQFFDKWVRGAGISRDVSALTIAAGGTALAAGLVAASVDVTGASAAGFALSASMALRSSTALMTDRYNKGKAIEKGQKEVRENLRARGILLV